MLSFIGTDIIVHRYQRNSYPCSYCVAWKHEWLKGIKYGTIPRRHLSIVSLHYVVSQVFSDGPPTKSRIKSQLVRILPFFINLPVQRRKIHSLIQALEAQYTPPSDWDKLVASLEGNWTLGFSSTTLGVPSGSLMVNKVMQEITRRNDSKDGLKELNMLNICHWKYREMDCFGRFEIYCRLTLLSRNRMICQVLEYTLIPEGQVKLKEPQALVRQLQRSLPREFFDPRDALVETTYVDEDMKIVKWMGKKFAGVRNIFYSLELSNPDCSTTSHG